MGLEFRANTPSLRHSHAPQRRALRVWQILKLAAGVGIAPTLSVFQTDVQTDYTIQRNGMTNGTDAFAPGDSSFVICHISEWSFRAVTLRGLPVINRTLCF